MALALILTLGSASARAQTVTVLFDEDDATGTDYRDASSGMTTGADALTLTGPNGDKMPLADVSYQGATSGLIEYRHTDGGSWALTIAVDGFGTVDLSEADSLVFFLNAPLPIAGPDLPRFALVDADGHSTALQPASPGGPVGLDAFRSGFLPGSTGTLSLSVEYLDVLPPDLARPGYPEDLRIVFADTFVSHSRAAIGQPAVPTRFRVERVATGDTLEFTFRDLDGDGTLGSAGELIDIYTPEAEGSTRQRPTWRVAAGNTPALPPGDGDVYFIAVDNGGLDGDPATWQRIGVALTDFGPLGAFDLTRVQAIRFVHGTVPTGSRTLWVDYVAGIDRGSVGSGPPAPAFTVQPGDSSVVLRWGPVPGASGTLVYRQTGTDAPFELLTDPASTVPNFADLDVVNGATYTYILRSVNVAGVPGPDSEAAQATPQAGLSDAYLDLTQETAFRYFWEEANPANGLIKDRSTPTSASSIAAVGFGLSAITVAIDKGWITRAEGIERVLTTLEFFRTCPQSPDTGVCGYRGFFYHFLDMQTGLRAGTNELSTIDTALLLGGILHMATYFDGASDDETRIRRLANEIYERVEWDWAQARPPAISHGWRPESGFIGNDWIGYNEAMLLYILALGSPTHPVGPEAWEAWVSGYDGQWRTFYGYTYLTFPPLFGHQYSHVWIDFRGIQDAYMLAQGIDYFQNSVLATRANRAYAIDNPGNHPNYGPNEWGLTASDQPPNLSCGSGPPRGYCAHGAPPAQSDNGTLTPTAPGGSYAFAPGITTTALRTFYRRYRDRLWGRYGLRDAYNIRENWFDTAWLGIDQGPILLMIENGRTEAIWASFMQHEAIQRGLERAGFIATGIDTEAGETLPRALTLAAFPNPFRDAATIRYALPAAGRVHLAVYDLLGRRVAVLVDADRPAGTHTARFHPGTLSAGLYLYRLTHADAVRTGTFVRLR